uniref:Potassium/proton antiporter CemA n=1 Tax=Neglectella solitaria TaxID=120749 RepID=C7BEG4_NEGSO|nr:chloroplast envelope membrane protein [Neglectella solitaria]
MQKQAFERSGLIPRSIIRTFNRFQKQLFPEAYNIFLQEFRISRYQVIVSVKSLAILFFIPILTNCLVKFFLFTPLTEFFWNNYQTEIFLNFSQQTRALKEIQKFEESMYFDNLLDDKVFFYPSNELISLYTTQPNISLEENSIKTGFQEKTIEIALKYNQETIIALTNIFGDFFTFLTIIFLFLKMKPQIIILKSFLTESIYSLSDTTKSFLLIFFTDLLVGFHSPRGWDFFLELFLQHFGLPQNPNFILLFVAVFPVLLDTVFKYWIFRYLNKISPSTVATYHNMIE